jgi:alkyl hydroperoxide reductase subunit F
LGFWRNTRQLLITKEFGGQSVVSDDIQNWIGTPHISGMDLAKQLEAHVKEYADDVLTTMNDLVTSVEKIEGGVRVHTDSGKTVTSRALLMTAGSNRRKLDVPGAAEFEHKGLTYCASCDGPLFSGRDVVVIGGGNAGFETAAQLLAYVKSVTLIDYSDTFKAEAITVKKVLEHPNMTAINNIQTLEIKGTALVTAIVYKNHVTGEITEKPTQGIFVEVGQIPNTHFLEGIVEMTPFKQVKIDPRTQRTSVEGIWAAGDCTDILYHQNNIAVGDAVRALEDIYVALKTKYQFPSKSPGRTSSLYPHNIDRHRTISGAFSR